MALARCLTNPTLRLVKLRSGRTVTVEQLGYQHYLVWDQGTPLTEVQCIPTESSRWYWRGSGLQWSETRADAIQKGIVRNIKKTRIGGKPLEAWSGKAAAAIATVKR